MALLYELLLDIKIAIIQSIVVFMETHSIKFQGKLEEKCIKNCMKFGFSQKKVTSKNSFNPKTVKNVFN